MKNQYSNDQIDSLRENLKNLLSNYLFEFNNKATRLKICSDVKFLFRSLLDEELEIIDSTDTDLIHTGNISINIKDSNGVITTLGDYINSLYTKNNVREKVNFDYYITSDDGKVLAYKKENEKPVIYEAAEAIELLLKYLKEAKNENT